MSSRSSFYWATDRSAAGILFAVWWRCVLVLVLGLELVPRRLQLGQGLADIGQQIVDVLGAHRQPHCAGRYAAPKQLLPGHLGVSGGGGMDDERLDIGHVGQQ